MLDHSSDILLAQTQEPMLDVPDLRLQNWTTIVCGSGRVGISGFESLHGSLATSQALELLGASSRLLEIQDDRYIFVFFLVSDGLC